MAVANLTQMLNGKINKNFRITRRIKWIKIQTDRTSEMVDVGQMPTSCFEFGKKTFKKVPKNCRCGKRTIEFDYLDL